MTIENIWLLINNRLILRMNKTKTRICKQIKVDFYWPKEEYYHCVLGVGPGTAASAVQGNGHGTVAAVGTDIDFVSGFGTAAAAAAGIVDVVAVADCVQCRAAVQGSEIFFPLAAAAAAATVLAANLGNL